MNVRKLADYGTMYKGIGRKFLHGIFRRWTKLLMPLARPSSQRPEKGAASCAAEVLQRGFPDRTGFSPRNVRRMRDFLQDL